jgi:hypothetical protein
MNAYNAIWILVVVLVVLWLLGFGGVYHWPGPNHTVHVVLVIVLILVIVNMMNRGRP